MGCSVQFYRRVSPLVLSAIVSCRDERGVLDEETRLLLQSLSPTRLCHTLDAPCMVMSSAADGVSLICCFISTPSLLCTLCLVAALISFQLEIVCPVAMRTSAASHLLTLLPTQRHLCRSFRPWRQRSWQMRCALPDGALQR